MTQESRTDDNCVSWPILQYEFIFQPLGKSLDLFIARSAKTNATEDSILLHLKHLDSCRGKETWT